MPIRVKMRQAVQGYIQERKSEGAAAGTLRNHRQCLAKLTEITGDVYMSSVQRHHISRYFAEASLTRGPGIAIDYSCLRVYFEWCVANGYVGRFENPMEGRKRPKFMPNDRRRVPVAKFPALLDAAQRHDPRDRMLNSLGLYLFLRASEMRDLRIRDLDLDSGYINVRIFKTKQTDRMPICRELDRELRSWLITYGSLIGRPLEPEMFLLPGYQPRGRRPGYGDQSFEYVMEVLPFAQVRSPELYVQKALEGIGFATKDKDGASLREGVHTLRRSGARALFDALVSQSYDGALRRVQAMLHHADSRMTESYLGLDIDKHQRDELIRGVDMFPVQGGNVLALRSASA